MLTDTSVRVPKEIIQKAFDDIENFADIKTPINQPTGNFFYDKWTIKDQFDNTVWNEILSYFPNDIGEARIIKLESGKCYLQHSDIDDRYHLNLSGENSYLVDLENEEMHHQKPDGVIYEMDAGRLHSALNLGVNSRYQLVVRKLLTDKKINHTKNIVIKPICDKPRFVFDNEVSPILNKANKIEIISNFEVLEDGVSFLIESNETEFITKSLSQKFKVIVQ